MAKAKSKAKGQQPKGKAKVRPATRAEPERSRPANLHIRATQEWVEWVKEGARHCHLSASALIDLALIRYFKDEGFTRKPPRR
jgi:hypothetical protein